MKKNAVKKIISIFLAVITTGSILSGCASGNSGKTDEKITDGKAVSQNMEEVIISIAEEPETLDPCMGWGHGTMPLVQSTLVEYCQDMSFVNDLATEYSLSEDGLTWTFKLRDDVRFTDGEPLTASDVAFTFQTAKESQSALDLTFLDKVEALDDTTVLFTLKQPMSTFLHTAATVGIVPEHAYGADYGMHPIGSGPYKFVQWNKQEQLILEANEEYYGTVPPIKKVTIVFQDEDAAFAAVKAGQVDIALTAATLADTEIAGYQVEAVTTVDNRGLTLPVNPVTGKTTESGYEYGNDVTCHLEIRQAFAYGIDRELIAKAALNGFATPCYSENDGLPWNNPDGKLDTDVVYAKQLLKENGWEDTDGDGIVEKDGLKAEFTCIYPSGDSVRQAVAFAASEQLMELGIHMIVEGTSWDDISKRMFTDAVCMGWGSTNPYTSYCLFHSANMLQDDYYNPEGFSNKIVDNYMTAALKALTVEEANENWKLSQWDGTTGTSMKGDCPWVWLVNVQHLYYVREGLNIGEQQLHAHGASMSLLQNLKEWSWEEDNEGNVD